MLPEDLPRLCVQAIDHPAVLVFGWIETIAPEVEALLGCLLLIGADDGCQKDAVAPDDRRGPASAGNVAKDRRLAQGIGNLAPDDAANGRRVR